MGNAMLMMLEKIRKDYKVVVTVVNTGDDLYRIYVKGKQADDGLTAAEVRAYLRGFVYGLVRKQPKPDPRKLGKLSLAWQKWLKAIF